jgi:glycosyltransferase involved in cell wall biosynthesis
LIFSVYYRKHILNSVSKKRIIVSVTSDIVSDNRVKKVCDTLYKMGFDIILAGRKLPQSIKVLDRNYPVVRFRLPFTKGFLFYSCYNIRLLWFLMFSGFDLLLSNDLDTLPANLIAAKIKGKPVVYDSHEYFTETPELINRSFVRKFWLTLEQFLVPHLKYAITVCDPIAKIYFEKYGVKFHVVRNFSKSLNFKTGREIEYTAKNIFGRDDIILYQGALNAGRGLEYAIMAMQHVREACLVIAGDGDIKNELENLVVREGLTGRVKFIGRLTSEELAKYTPGAKIGISVEEDLGLSYHYALPNKLFDYIQSLVPVVVTDLPEMSAIVRKYNIGEVTPSLIPEELAAIFNRMLRDDIKREEYRRNLKIAAEELTWENEEKKIVRIFSRFL